MTGSDNLTPPNRAGTTDPGARDLESSESEDNFSDARSAPLSPVVPSTPKTRIEKVDNEPSYGEVPGTEAYRKREGDAEPDEIAVVGEQSSTDPSTNASPTPLDSQSIPKTVVEESAGGTGEHSEEFLEKRKADADADVVLKHDSEGDEKPSPEIAPSAVPEIATPTSPVTTEDEPEDEPEDPEPSPAPTSQISIPGPPPPADTSNSEEEEDDEDAEEDFGDDFDDFEEGGDDADFDDFEDGFEQPAPSAPATPVPPPNIAPTMLPFPIPYLDGLDANDVFAAADPCLDSLFPPEELDLPILPPLSKENPFFLTNRSASLWNQLVAPPPLSPPDWIRSRIRRLFLVSLGVPVDLDEILPASKQKKLVLPSSVHRRSSDSRSVSRVRQSEANVSSTSLDAQGNPKRATSKNRRKGPPPVPELDLVAASQAANTTDEALNGMTDDELRNHVKKLQEMEDSAKEVLEYWRKKTDEKIGDREAFEGVIENLVKHARKTRK